MLPKFMHMIMCSLQTSSIINILPHSKQHKQHAIAIRTLGSEPILQTHRTLVHIGLTGTS